MKMQVLVLMFITWTLAVFGVSVTASSLDASSGLPDLSAIPSCGLNCIVGQVTLSPCGLTDFDCICANTTLADHIEECLSTECSVRDALKTAKFSKDSCGVPPQDKSLIVWLVPLVVFVLSTTCFILRIISRLYVSQGIDFGDIIMGFCVLFTVPFLWSAFELARQGLGKDMWNIPADNVTSILNLYWWDEILYLAVLPLTRISILLFYLKLFPRRAMKIATYILIGVNVAYLITFMFATIFQCIPVDGAWKFWDGTYETRCTNIHVQSWAAAAINIAIDMSVIVLPLPELAKLSISTRKKIQILIMFSLGFLITIISIVRLQGLVLFANTTNVTYDYVEPGLYSIVEAEVGIICGCLPAIRALLGKLMPRIFPVTRKDTSKYHNDKSGSSNPSRNFSRLTSSHADKNINVTRNWSVQKSSSKPNSDTVELMPWNSEGISTVENSHEGRYNRREIDEIGQAV